MMCASSPIYNLYPANHSLLAVSSPDIMQGSMLQQVAFGVEGLIGHFSK